MELERRFIEGTEFSAVRKGYDPEEVDRHLREIGEAVELLKRSKSSAAAPSGSLAGAAAEQVRTIVEAAESSAAQIESGARAEADRVTGEAKRAAAEERDTAHGEAERVRREAEEAAREIRERAEAEAAEHVAKVQEATSGMRERADTVESDLQGLVDQLRGTVEALVESVRSSAGSLESELQGIQANLTVVRESRLEPVPEPPPEPLLEEEEEPDFQADAGQTTKLTSVVDPGDEPERLLEEEEEGPHPDAEPLEDELEYQDELQTGEDAAVEDLAADEEPEPAASAEGDGAEGARLIALNMALNGTPREETARYLEENFDLEDQDAILDEVYARVSG